MYAVLHVCVNCFVVRVCAVSRMYINVCNSDVLLHFIFQFIVNIIIIIIV